MEITKYINKRCNKIGDIITELTNDLCNNNLDKNILFIRTNTTGEWLDRITIENENITRILYYNEKMEKPNIKEEIKKNTIIIHSDELEQYLITLNKKFDIISVDSWHEKYESSRDLRILGTLLTENGIIISHDCCPWNKRVANPTYISGEWCGESYISYIEFAYNNPELYYGVIYKDTGIGIISKQPNNLLSNTLNRQKQEELLKIYNNSKDVYYFFAKNAKDLINLI